MLSYGAAELTAHKIKDEYLSTTYMIVYRNWYIILQS
jgi:hypothetical protein